MTVAERQLIEWCEARHWMSLSTMLAVGYLRARALGHEVSAKLAKECQRTLEQLHVQRVQEIAR